MVEPVVFNGDCLAVMAGMPAASVDSIVTDPPYHLTSIVKRVGPDGASPAMSSAQRRFAETGGADRPPGTDQFGRLSKGFMGKTWDGGDVAFRPETWAAALRVLKPGGHLVAFGAPKNYHRLACAIEDAGFEIRDSLMWVFGSGFPKSLDVSKAIDKAAGAERPIVGRGENYGKSKLEDGKVGYGDYAGSWDITAPATPDAAEWQGWGTALKPAYEPIILARRPLAGTVAETVLAHGTGALNIDACRVPHDEECRMMAPSQANIDHPSDKHRQAGRRTAVLELKPSGRWPANLVHDGSEEVLAGFPQTVTNPGTVRATHKMGMFPVRPQEGRVLSGGDSGSAARFFASFPQEDDRRFLYHAKASAKDRAGSKHPTVKPIALMRWLVRLITPPGGVVLDPFAGSGTTGQAAMEEGFDAVLIEREAEYIVDIERRMERAPKQETMAL